MKLLRSYSRKRTPTLQEKFPLLFYLAPCRLDKLKTLTGASFFAIFPCFEISGFVVPEAYFGERAVVHIVRFGWIPQAAEATHKPFSSLRCAMTTDHFFCFHRHWRFDTSIFVLFAFHSLRVYSITRHASQRRP